MPKKEQFPPYEERMSLSADGTQWIIKVTFSDGAGVPSEKFFQAPVLLHHLREKGISDAFAAHGAGGYQCLAWRGSPTRSDAQGFGRVLLQILQTYYAQFKGRRVNWKVS